MAMTTVLMLMLTLMGQAGADGTEAVQQTPALRIANAYGFAGWEQVSRIEFTFNVKVPGREEPVVRRWSWSPKAGEVTRHVEGGEVIELLLVPGTSNLRVGFDLNEAAIDAHKAFINDHYWLLFPFQLVWSNPTITEHGERPLPMGDGVAQKVTVQYGDAGGYTPGDAYDLYLGPDDRIVQWVYRRGGVSAEEGRPATWEGNTAFGPLTIATEHRGPELPGGGFRLWFSDVRVQVEDAEGNVSWHAQEAGAEE